MEELFDEDPIELIEKYEGHLKTLTDSTKFTNARYQAVLQIVHVIEKSERALLLAAKDVDKYISVLKETKRKSELQPINVNTLHILVKISQVKDHAKVLIQGGLPKVCLELIVDDRFRPLAFTMMFCLLDNNNSNNNNNSASSSDLKEMSEGTGKGVDKDVDIDKSDVSMAEELVEVGVLDALFKYSNSFERSYLSSHPENALRVRRTVFQCLEEVSKKFPILLVQRGVFEIIEKYALEVNISVEYKDIIPDALIAVVRRDEMILLKCAIGIVFNVCVKVENFGSLYGKKDPKEVKYIYDLDSDDEEQDDKENEKDKDKKGKSDIKYFRKVSGVFGFNTPEEQKVETEAKVVLESLSKTKILEVFVKVISYESEELPIKALKALWRVANVLHLFTTEDFRLSVVQSCETLSYTYPGHKRFLCLSILTLLSRNIDNLDVINSSGVLNLCWKLGMEESGEMLNAVTRLLLVLSCQPSAAEELVSRSDCPRVLVKILLEDCKLTIPTLKPDGSENPDWGDETASQCLFTLVNLAQTSKDSRIALVESGATVVMERILEKHENDMVGMVCMMGLSSVFGQVDSDLQPFIGQGSIPRASKEMIKLMIKHIGLSMEGKSSQGLIFSVEELSQCLNNLCSAKYNIEPISCGLPLYVKMLKLFGDEYGIKETDKVSKNSVQNVLGLLIKLASSKYNLNKFVELGESLTSVLQEVHGLVSDAAQLGTSSSDVYFDAKYKKEKKRASNEQKRTSKTDVREFDTLDNNVVQQIEYLLLKIENEATIAAKRESNNEAARKKLRKSSRVAWKLLQDKQHLADFLEQNNYELEEI